MKYYCYVYYNEDWVAYYVGKGSWSRSHCRTDGISVPAKQQIQVFKFEHEWQAYELEVELINFWKRKSDGGTLDNASLGGPGCKGYRHTEEHKQKMSKLFQGRELTETAKEKIGEANRNPSAKTRKKMSDAKKGKKLSLEHRRKMSDAHKGKHLSLEHRRKLSEAAKKRWARIS